MAQPITLIAEAKVQLGAGARSTPPGPARPPWLRMYEHGMALTSVVSERLGEAAQVLEVALAATRSQGCAVAESGAAPAAGPGAGSDPCRAEAMVLTQLGVVAARQGRSADALRLLDDARRRLVAPYPPALDAIAADALSRVWKWREAVPYARRAADVAQGSTLAWVVLARVLASSGDDRGALAAAQRGLALAPRDADLLRTQATSLKALGSPEAPAALAAYDRFRAPDQAAELRIVCARSSARCSRERESGHTHALLPAPASSGR